jgi:TolA-binding protein
LIGWAQSAQVGRSAPVGQLGGFQLTGVVRLDYEHGGREAYLALDGIPVEAAHATVTHLAENPLTLVRQLEHRIADLEGRRARMMVRQQEAAQEIARAREGLARPFKYAEDLQAAATQLAVITEQMQQAATRAAPASDDTTSARPARVESDGSPLEDVSDTSPATADGDGRSQAQNGDLRDRSPRRSPARYPARPRPPAPPPPDVYTYPPATGIDL